MPDCDVELAPHYINAGAHKVSVVNGNGSGTYNYKALVSISPNTPNRYKFSHWSGSTSYLTDIYSPSHSFTMPDVDLSFTANFDYVYSYNDVQVIDGLILVNDEAVTQAEGLKQLSEYTLVPTPPNSDYDIDRWEVQGYGQIKQDRNGNMTNTFIVGDGDATIIGHYGRLRTLRLENINNEGTVITSRILEGRKVVIGSRNIVGDYRFDGWSMSEGVTPSNASPYDFIMPANDVTIVANYKLRKDVQVTINYGHHSEVVTMKEGGQMTITADPAESGKVFNVWVPSDTYIYISYPGAITTTFAIEDRDCAITATYLDATPPPPKHYLTVNNGETSAEYAEGSTPYIIANAPPNYYEFDYWEIVSGDGSINDIYNRYTTYHMGTTDGEITAHYKPIPWFDVSMINGYIRVGDEWVSNATLIRNSNNEIKLKAGSVPLGYQFDQWEVYVNGVLQTNSNDVVQPLAEHTSLRNVTRSMVVKAGFRQPDSARQFTLSIERKDGTVDQYKYALSDLVEIHASEPDPRLYILQMGRRRNIHIFQS